jgi:hypothetical protein
MNWEWLARPLLTPLTPCANLVRVEWAAWQNASLRWNGRPSGIICERIEGSVDRNYRSLERIYVPITQAGTNKRMFFSVAVNLLE